LISAKIEQFVSQPSKISTNNNNINNNNNNSNNNNDNKNSRISTAPYGRNSRGFLNYQQNLYNCRYPTTAKIHLNNSGIRMMIRITTKILTVIASHASHHSKNLSKFVHGYMCFRYPAGKHTKAK